MSRTTFGVDNAIILFNQLNRVDEERILQVRQIQHGNIDLPAHQGSICIILFDLAKLMGESLLLRQTCSPCFTLGIPTFQNITNNEQYSRCARPTDDNLRNSSPVIARRILRNPYLGRAQIGNGIPDHEHDIPGEFLGIARGRRCGPTQGNNVGVSICMAR